MYILELTSLRLDLGLKPMIQNGGGLSLKEFDESVYVSCFPDSCQAYLSMKGILHEIFRLQAKVYLRMCNFLQ